MHGKLAKASKLLRLCLVLCLCLMGRATLAQFNSGLEGTTTDSSGAAVPGVVVTLTETTTNVSQKVTSDDNGTYRFSRLASGTYKIEATKDGFSTLNRENVRLQSAQILTVALSLAVGSVNEAVTVSDTPPAIQLDQAKIGATLDRETVNQLPLAGRDIFNLITQVPGTTGTGNASANASDNDVFSLVASPRVTANGQRGDANSFYLDGTLATSNPDPGQFSLTPNPDSIKETVVSLNDYSAEYGRSGSIVIRAVSATGSNKFHGSLFFNHQDSLLTGRNYFQFTKDPVTNRYFPAFRRNEFGGSFGGPIQRDKTFFFVSYDQLKSSQASTFQSVVEHPDFVNFLKTNYPNRLATNLLTKYPATAQTVVPGTIQTVQMLQPNCATSAPLAGIPCNLNVLQTVRNSFSPRRDGLQYSIRGDRYFRDSKDRLAATVYRKTNPTQGTNVRQAFAVPNSFPSTVATLDYTHVFSPNILNDAAIGYTRLIGYGNCNNCQVPVITISTFSGFGNGFAPASFLQNDFHWRDVLSINHGIHAIRVGVDVFADQDNVDFTGPQLRPSYDFSATSGTGLSSVFDFANDRPTTEGNINYDLRTGGPSTQHIGYRSRTFGFFAQDDLKLTKTFTVNAGLRWDFSSNPYEVNGRLSNVVLGSGSDLRTQIANSSVAIVPKVFNKNNIAYFAPRLGFAWDALGNGKLSIRAATGVFFNRWPNKVWSDAIRTNSPYQASLTADRRLNGPQPVYGLCATATAPFNCPVPGGLPIGLNSRGGALAGLSAIGGTDPSLKYSYNISRFLGIQYAISSNWVLEADYTGAVANHLYINTDVNRCAGCFNPTTGGRTGPNPYFSAINYTSNQANSNYNGGTIAISHRFSHGLSAQANYTFGKTFSLADSIDSGAGNDFAPVFNPYNLNAQYSLASFDIPKAFSANGVYQVPAFKGSNAFVQNALGGWQLSGVLSLQSGYPYTVQDCNHSPDGGVSCVLPNVTQAARSQSCDRGGFGKGCLSPTSFSLPCPLNANGQLVCTNGQWEGNAQRNLFRGPGFANTDFNLSKYFGVFNHFFGDSVKFQLRGEFFNVFNRVNFQPLGYQNVQLSNAGVSQNPNFGKATSAYNPRTIQVGARIEF